MIDRPEANRYRWQEVAQDHPLDGVDRRRVFGDKAVVAEISLRQGTKVSTHHHESEQFTCVLSGKLLFGIGAEGSAERHELTIRAGEVLHLSSNVPHSAEAIEDTRVLDVFAPPSETGLDRPGS